MELLGAEFSLDAQLMFEVMTGTMRNQITFLPTGYLIDLFRLGDDSHHQALFARRVRTEIPELAVSVWIPTAEDIVIQKLRWGRRKDQDDIVNILSLNHEQIDWDYINEWSAVHDTTKLLRELRDEIPDESP